MCQTLDPTATEKANGPENADTDDSFAAFLLLNRLHSSIIKYFSKFKINYYPPAQINWHDNTQNTSFPESIQSIRFAAGIPDAKKIF